MTKNISILTILLFASCGTKSSDLRAIDEVMDSLTTLKNYDQEDFNEFFKKFTSDSLFQVERVKFPWRLRMAIDGREVVEETSKENWTHETFYYEESYATRQINAYTQEIRTYGDTTVRLELRGVDNGIHVDYEFARDKGKWILVSGEDYSD